MIQIKRVYAPLSSDDGLRILVDRIWPRGMSKAQARIDEWHKEWAPSTALRRWFAHDVGKWTEFQKRYRSELTASAQKSALKDLAHRARWTKITLVYSAADEEHNQAAVLKQYLERLA